MGLIEQSRRTRRKRRPRRTNRKKIRPRSTKRKRRRPRSTKRKRRRPRRTRRGGAGDVNIQTRLKMSKEKFLQIRVRSLEKELATCNDEKKQMYKAIHGYGGYEDVIKGYKKKGKSDKKSLAELRIFDMPKGYGRAQTKYTVVDHNRREAEVRRGLPEGISPGSSVEVKRIGHTAYTGKVQGAKSGDYYTIVGDITRMPTRVASRFVTKI